MRWPVLRVLHVMGRMGPSGTERQLVGMLKAARDVYWDPTLCVLYPGFDLTIQVARDGTPTMEMPFTTAYDPRRMQRLRTLIRDGGFDVVHSSLWGANLFTRLAAAQRSRPAVVVSERSVEDFRSRSGRLIDQALRPLADHYIGNSQDVVDFICRTHRVPSSRVSLIRNGINGDVFYPDNGPAEPTARRRIGCVGRLIHNKAFDVMVTAMPAILRVVPTELLIAGEGPERVRLERAAAGLPVSFVGFLPTPDAVADFLRTLDLLVLPSRHEGLPNVVLEALACGIPVVATDVPGMEEATGNRTALVPADDPDKLAVAVTEALLGPARPPAQVAIQSFLEVAVQHRRAFELALEHRRHGRRTRRPVPALAPSGPTAMMKDQ
jgi:glycosyltransferase involved in cell wall biosynthesis